VTHYADCPYCDGKIWDVDEYGTGISYFDCPNCGERVRIFNQEILKTQIAKADSSSKSDEVDEK